MTKHIPVLLDSVMNALGDIRNQNIIDATFGAGGYTRSFLSAGANVTAFDRDSNVLADAEKIATEYGGRFKFIARPFSAISELDGRYDAIVFDLGISSMQIDVASRGFSFRYDGPLDMRMSSSGLSASEMIDALSQTELSNILRDFGDIRHSMSLAGAIKSARPQTTFALKELIHNPRDIAPVFQALRIAVNDEFGELRRALSAVPDLLKDGGRCICVTFHSIEDRLVKSIFREWTTPVGDVHLPTVLPARFSLLRTAIPSQAEVEYNPRSRSAHMRGVIKTY